MKFLRDIIEQKSAAVAATPQRVPAFEPEHEAALTTDGAVIAEPEALDAPQVSGAASSPLRDIFAEIDAKAYDDDSAVEEPVEEPEAEPYGFAALEAEMEEAEDEAEDLAQADTLAFLPADESEAQDLEPSWDDAAEPETEDEVAFDDDIPSEAEDEMTPGRMLLRNREPDAALAPDADEDAEDQAPAVDPAPAANPAWDFDDEETSEATPTPVPAADKQAPPAAPAKVSAGRAKTRLLGFTGLDSADDPFAQPTNADCQAPTQFPVGWLVVVEGPGRGSAFSLHNGVAQIGRGDGQTIRLDFGDTSISRENHAAIAYDAEQNGFFLGHGGKANLVRCNGKPVLSTQELASGDTIRIGETTLQFVALCGQDFKWSA